MKAVPPATRPCGADVVTVTTLLVRETVEAATGGSQRASDVSTSSASGAMIGALFRRARLLRPLSYLSEHAEDAVNIGEIVPLVVTQRKSYLVPKKFTGNGAGMIRLRSSAFTNCGIGVPMGPDEPYTIALETSPRPGPAAVAEVPTRSTDTTPTTEPIAINRARALLNIWIPYDSPPRPKLSLYRPAEARAFMLTAVCSLVVIVVDMPREAAVGAATSDCCAVTPARNEHPMMTRLWGVYCLSSVSPTGNLLTRRVDRPYDSDRLAVTA
jgi:hypothetical protein